LERFSFLCPKITNKERKTFMYSGEDDLAKQAHWPVRRNAK
jgi:hypothetical protein